MCRGSERNSPLPVWSACYNASLIFSSRAYEARKILLIAQEYILGYEVPFGLPVKIESKKKVNKMRACQMGYVRDHYKACIPLAYRQQLLSNIYVRNQMEDAPWEQVISSSKYNVPLSLEHVLLCATIL